MQLKRSEIIKATSESGVTSEKNADQAISGAEPPPLYLLALQSWESFCIILGFSFFISVMGPPTLQGYCEHEVIETGETSD